MSDTVDHSSLSFHPQLFQGLNVRLGIFYQLLQITTAITLRLTHESCSRCPSLLEIRKRYCPKRFKDQSNSVTYDDFVTYTAVKGRRGWRCTVLPTGRTIFCLVHFDVLHRRSRENAGSWSVRQFQSGEKGVRSGTSRQILPSQISEIRLLVFF